MGTGAAPLPFPFAPPQSNQSLTLFLCLVRNLETKSDAGNVERLLNPSHAIEDSYLDEHLGVVDLSHNGLYIFAVGMLK